MVFLCAVYARGCFRRKQPTGIVVRVGVIGHMLGSLRGIFVPELHISLPILRYR